MKRKIKVMRIVSRLNIGGPTLHMKILTEGLDKSKFETLLIVGSLSEHEGDMSYLLSPVTRKYVKYLANLQREIHLIKDFIAFWGIFKIIRKVKPDIVHTHMAKAGALGRVAALLYKMCYRKKIRLIHTFHGNVLEGYFNPALSYLFILIERIIAKFTDTIIAISNTQKWELVEKYEVSTDKKVNTINLGFDLNPYTKLDRYRGHFRKKIGVNENCKIIGIVGRLVPIKNHFMFIDAAKEFIDKYKEKNAKFVIIGDGELKTELKQHVLQSGIENNVIFCGWERDIHSVYGSLDILVLTSMNEGTPVSIIEAMASGVPVITTGVGGVKDLLGDYENEQIGSLGFKICERGILCPKNDSATLAKCIDFVLNSDPKKRAMRSEMSRQYVLKNYSDGRLISEIEKLYLRLTCN